MRAIAVYNMKGGVGKTTTAVNMSYLAAAGGERVLLWDLDPQAASSFAFRVRPHVEGFGRKSLKSGKLLADAIRETDYPNLDLLPADFAYRKLDRLLADIGKPERVVTTLLDTLGRDYDVVFLDCPAGFSLLTEGIFATADAVLVPTIPTVLSLRTVARLLKWAERSESSSLLATFFSMVDTRKALHRRTCQWSADHPELFLAAHIPYASVVEQMAVRRLPLPAFAPKDPATAAFAGIWNELEGRLVEWKAASPRPRHEWGSLLRTIERLIERLEAADEQAPAASSQAQAGRHGEVVRWRRHDRRPSAPALEREPGVVPAREHAGGGVRFVHTFDTHRRDLREGGQLLEVHEHAGVFRVVAARLNGGGGERSVGCVEAQIDAGWAVRILSGTMSPLEALERRVGTPAPSLIEQLRDRIDGRTLQRIESRAAPDADLESQAPRSIDLARAPSSSVRVVNPAIRLASRR